MGSPFRILLLWTVCLLPGSLGFQIVRAPIRRENPRLSVSRQQGLLVEVADPAVAKAPKTKDLTILSEQKRVFPGLSSTDPDQVYRNGLITVAGITLLFASNSPILHFAFSGLEAPPPVLLLNAACSMIAVVGMILGGPLLERAIPAPSQLSKDANQDRATTLAGLELGLYKFLGTVLNIYGLSLTSAGHGAFLIQLTTLFVPVAQGIMGVPISRRIWTAIALAITGVAVFAQDGSSSSSLTGDAFCLGAAVMYATYDLRLFHWGRKVDTRALITSKIITQATLSALAVMGFAWEPTTAYLASLDGDSVTGLLAVVLWSGVIVNALVPYLQVGGQQAVGPAKAQILYATQPLLATVMSFVFLGESIGLTGCIGASAFLSAIFLAASESQDENMATRPTP